MMYNRDYPYKMSIDITSKIEDREDPEITPDEESSISYFEVLPPEIIGNIILDLNVEDIVVFCSLNKRLTSKCEPLVWKDKYQQLYGKYGKYVEQTPIYLKLTWKQILLRIGIYGFGWNRLGQLGLGDGIPRNKPQRIPDKRFQLIDRTVKITQVSVGNHTICLDENGNVWGFGCNLSGQLAMGFTYEMVPKQVLRLPRIIQISAGGNHTVCLDDEMNVWGFGDNDDGQLGLGYNSETEPVPQQVLRLPRIIQISAGGEHTVCLDDEGNVWGFGMNRFGQLGLGDTSIMGLASKLIPKQNPNLSNIVQVSAGRNHTICVDKKGNVWSFGWNSHGQLGLGTDEEIVDTPRMIDPSFFRVDRQPVRIIQVSAGGAYTVCIDDEMNVWSFGRNNFGQLGLGTDEEIVDTPRMIDPNLFHNVRITQVSAGGTHTVCLDDERNIWTFGRNDLGQLGLGNNENPTPQLIKHIRAIQVSAGSTDTMLIGYRYTRY